MADTMINLSFINKVLENSDKTNQPKPDIVSYEVIPTIEKGGNYVTEITRMRLNLRENGTVYQKPLIIKGMPADPARLNFLQKRGVFRKEYEMYTKLIPGLVSFQTGPKKIVPPTAKCVYAVLDNTAQDCIVFEDLGPQGYEMANKMEGLDFDHCSLVLGELAKWHALSWANKKKGSLKQRFPCVNDVMYKMDQDQIWKPVLDACYSSVIQIVQAATKDDRLVQKLKKYEANFMEIMADHMNNPPEKDINVVIHGDCWVNNFLFKYEQKNGKRRPAQVKFVDLQCSVYAPLTYDLLYFFYSSTTGTLRQQHLEELLSIYHKNFQAALSQLGVSFPSFTLQQLKKEYVEAMPYGFKVCCFILPIIMNSSLDIAEVAGGEGENLEGKMAELLRSSPECQAIQKRLLDALYEVDQKVGI